MQQICEDLHLNRCVALPSETVYGLAANAHSDTAVANVYALKNRPQVNPLILHGASLEMLSDYAEFTDLARELAAHFWPGPLTLILKAKKGISALARAGLDTVGVRVPNHPAFLDVLTRFDAPVVAPSANPSNYLSATTANDVSQGFRLQSGCTNDAPQKLLNILDGGMCSKGIESTILDLTSEQPRLLRPGALSREEIATVTPTIVGNSSGKIIAPGQLKTHYAPGFPLRLNAIAPNPGEAWIGFGIDNHQGELSDERLITNLSGQGCLIEAARNLFNVLHQLDRLNHLGAVSFRACAVAKIPQIGLGIGINDRLMRAATPRKN